MRKILGRLDARAVHKFDGNGQNTRLNNVGDDLARDLGTVVAH